MERKKKMTVQERLREMSRQGALKMLKDWGEFLGKVGYQVKFYKHGGFRVWLPKIEKELINTKRRKRAALSERMSSLHMLREWGEFLSKAVLDVKFHRHGGFTAKPPKHE